MIKSLMAGLALLILTLPLALYAKDPAWIDTELVCFEGIEKCLDGEKFNHHFIVLSKKAFEDNLKELQIKGPYPEDRFQNYFRASGLRQLAGKTLSLMLDQELEERGLTPRLENAMVIFARDAILSHAAFKEKLIDNEKVDPVALFGAHQVYETLKNHIEKNKDKLKNGLLRFQVELAPDKRFELDKKFEKIKKSLGIMPTYQSFLFTKEDGVNSLPAELADFEERIREHLLDQKQRLAKANLLTGLMLEVRPNLKEELTADFDEEVFDLYFRIREKRFETNFSISKTLTLEVYGEGQEEFSKFFNKTLEEKKEKIYQDVRERYMVHPDPKGPISLNSLSPKDIKSLKKELWELRPKILRETYDLAFGKFSDLIENGQLVVRLQEENFKGRIGEMLAEGLDDLSKKRYGAFVFGYHNDDLPLVARYDIKDNPYSTRSLFVMEITKGEKTYFGVNENFIWTYLEEVIRDHRRVEIYEDVARMLFAKYSPFLAKNIHAEFPWKKNLDERNQPLEEFLLDQLFLPETKNHDYLEGYLGYEVEDYLIPRASMNIFKNSTDSTLLSKPSNTHREKKPEQEDAREDDIDLTSRGFNPGNMGPNALPPLPAVDPVVGNDMILTVGTSVELNNRFRDVTGTGRFSLLMPFAGRAALEVFGPAWEFWSVSKDTQQKWGLDRRSGQTGGNFWVGARFLAFRANRGKWNGKWDLGLRFVIQTTTGSQKDRRFINAPSYLFQVLAARDLYNAKDEQKFIQKVRLIINLGFFAWQQGDDRQNDAPTVAVGLALTLRDQSQLSFDLSGYFGYQGDDKPIRLSVRYTKMITQHWGFYVNASASVSPWADDTFSFGMGVVFRWGWDPQPRCRRGDVGDDDRCPDPDPEEFLYTPQAS